ncbi:MAG: hypothetical protein IJI40_09590 [Firmicutes bacterium]|nr:hypothetical protein [Bacillota bacterium]MBQ6606961.1 hypothetical protein [Bacillota bacterium]
MQRKGKTAVIILCCLALTLVLCVIGDHLHTKAANDRFMELRMQAIAADPDAVTVKDSDGHVITDVFLSDHLEELQAGEYWPAIEEIRGNRYSFSISVTPKNSQLLNATP